MHVDVIQTTDELHRLAPAWEALWQGDPGADIFTSADLAITWYECFCRPGRSPVLVVHDGLRMRGLHATVARPYVLVVRDGSEPVAIMPLVALRTRWRRLPARILGLPLNNHTMRSGLIANPAAASPWAPLARHLAADPEWDLLIMDGVQPRAADFTAFLAEASRAGLPVSSASRWTAGYTAVSGSWEGFLAARSSNFRKSLRRHGRALAERGRLDFECHSTPEAVRSAMQVFLDVDRESWKASEGESVALHPELDTFYGTLLERCARKGRAEVWILRVGGEAAAATLCLRDRGSLYLYKASFRERFGSPLSPGFVLISHVLEDAWGRGFEAVDYLGRTPYIDRYTSHYREFRRFMVFPRRAQSSLLRAVEWVHDRVFGNGEARMPEAEPLAAAAGGGDAEEGR